MNSIIKTFSWLLLAPALLPLVYIDGLLYPYVAPKTLIFRGLGIITFATFCYLALSGREFYWGRLKKKTALIPVALLTIAYATSLFGVDFYNSFWSVFDRGDGLLTLTVAVFFFYAILLYADKKFLQKLFTIAAWMGSAVALYVILQSLQRATGMDFPLIAETKGRLGGTFGNAAFLASYLGVTMWATLATLREYRGVWQKILYGSFVLQFAGILIAATRGTMLALLVVGFLTLIYLAWKGKGRTRTLARVALAGGLVLSALFFGFREQLKQAPIESVRRVASISIQDETVSSRLFVWQNALSEGLKNPLTGYGAEHVGVLFNRFYDPTLILEEWFDRTHNAFLDYFVQYGIFGLLLYGGLVGSLGYVGLALLRRGERYGATLLLMAGVYAIQNFFVFDTSMTLWLLFATTAAAFSYTSTESPSRMRASPWLGFSVAVAALLLLYPIVIQPLRANIYLAQGYTDHVVDVDNAIASFNRGLSLNTYADTEYGYQAYSMYTDHQQTMLTGQKRVAAYRYALETLKANFERYPYDARTATYLAHVLDSAPPEEKVDEELERAVLARAIELSPKRAQAFYILANISLKKGDQATNAVERNQYYREAIKGLEEYAALVPRLAETHFIIANLYLAIGDNILAGKWAEEGLSLYNEYGGGGAPSKAIKYYIAVEDWPNSERFMEDILGDVETTDSYEELYDLAKLYFLNGNRERALQLFERIKREKPGLVETDPAFLKAVSE